ncbi:MAG TPA: tetratricopeptide repeat protein [Steroidobacteraceae bacterium]|nr:tetratricopeptide repeat protein [Steroidobacteraceae bacterium]
MRLRGIGPEVLLLCFLLVGAAAFALGRRSARGRRLRRDGDYFAGLDHLVNDRFDRATEVFTRLATKSDDAEIQFALGSLMRRRGEVDRAIAIHLGLASHNELTIREQASFALGLDYLSAGLMDRAEEKLRSLLTSTRYRPAVLERLAWVYEQQREWRAALDLWRELPAEKQRELAVVAAHYCCELGESALAAADFAEASAQVAAARVHAPNSARAALLAARIAAATGEESKALDLYVTALGTSRAMRVAFEPEARQVLQSQVAALNERLNANPPTDEAVPPEPPRFRCEECGVASVTWHWRCPSCRNWDSLRSTQNRGI